MVTGTDRHLKFLCKICVLHILNTLAILSHKNSDGMDGSSCSSSFHALLFPSPAAVANLNQTRVPVISRNYVVIVSSCEQNG